MNDKSLKIKQILSFAFENHKKNNLKLAEQYYKKILKIDFNHIDAIYLLGTIYLQKRNFNKAIELFNKALKINPNHVSTIHNLGSTFIEMGEYQEAKKLLNKVIEIQPKHADAHYNLGNIYRYYGEFKKAEKHYQDAIQIQPNNAKVYNNLGNVLKDLGKFDEAIGSYNKAIEIEFNHANAYHNLGNTYKQLGELEKAKNFYQKALKHQPSNLETLNILIGINKEYLDLNLKKKINETIKSKNISEKNLAYGNFILAKYEYQKKNFKKEFNYLLKGHSCYFKFRKKEFDKGASYWLKEIPKIQELMNFGKSNNIKKNYTNIKPIFIVGVPRCGSTLIEKVIASGSKKIPIGEETAIVSFFVGEKVVAKESFSLNIENFRKKIVERYEHRGLLQKNSENIFTDKSLDNFFFIGLIKEIFPNAKVINCKRKALASIVSILKNNLGDVSWAHNIKHIFQFFDIYHEKVGEVCDYISMKAEMLKGVSGATAEQWSTIPDMDIDASWLDLETVFDGISEGFSALISGIFDGL